MPSNKPNVVRGPIEYIRDYAKRFFADIPSGDVMEKYGTNTIQKGSIKDTYRMVSPEWGIIAEFDSLGKAQKFMRAARNSVDELAEIGLMKGVPDISINGGRIVARDIKGATHAFNDVRALKDWLKSIEADPYWTKELMPVDRHTITTAIDSLDPELRAQYLSKSGMSGGADYNKVMDHVRSKATWSDPTPMGEYGSVAARKYGTHNILQMTKDMFQTPTYARARRIVGEQGGEILGQSFEQMEKQIKNGRALQAQATQLIDGINKFEGKLSKKRRAVVRPFLEVDPSEWAAKSQQWNIELTQADRTFLERYRRAADAFGKAFGIDGYKMIDNYLPRIREFIKQNPDVMKNATYAHEVIGKMDSHLAKELEFFSEYLRADELNTFVHTADPLDILNAYARKGVKNMTLGKTYNELKDRWNVLIREGSITPAAANTMLSYMESVMGMYSDTASKVAEQSAREIGAVFAKQINAGTNAGAIKDFVNTMHGFTIAATMSFRPWPVIRNMQQVWTTLAPMFGNSNVMRAMKKLGDEEYAKKLHQKLVDNGRLQDRIPIFGGIYEAQGLTGRLNKFGMSAYRNSDDYTRMMVDEVVTDVFTDAVAKLEAGTINEKQFFRLANLQRLDDFDQREIVKRLRGNYTDASGVTRPGGFDDAVNYYGDIVTRETMFAYTAGSNPIMFNGMWGRIFGMFGHYPVYYAQTLANGLRRGNLADKAQFIGRVVANSAA